MAWHYCYFRAVVYFWIVQVRGGILEQSQNGKRRKNKLKKKIRNQKFTKGDAISQLEGYSSECLLYIDWKKRKTRCRVENISWRCWKEIPFRFIVRVMSLLWVLILLFYFFFLCWNVIHMWLHVIQSDSFLSLSFWLYGGHVCCIWKKKKKSWCDLTTVTMWKKNVYKRQTGFDKYRYVHSFMSSHLFQALFFKNLSDSFFLLITFFCFFFCLFFINWIIVSSQNTGLYENGAITTETCWKK